MNAIENIRYINRFDKWQLAEHFFQNKLQQNDGIYYLRINIKTMLDLPNTRYSFIYIVAHRIYSLHYATNLITAILILETLRYYTMYRTSCEHYLSK